MSDKQRKNSRIDLESSGGRFTNIKADKMFDSTDALPNDSDTVRQSTRLYVAQMIDDYSNYGAINTQGTVFLDASDFRTDNGFGSTTDWTQYSSTGNWIDSYGNLENFLQYRIDPYITTDGGGTRDAQPLYTHSVLCLDSDGKTHAININTLYKIHFSRFVQNDFWEQRKLTDSIRNVFATDSDVDLYLSKIRSNNWEASNFRVNETNPNVITTQIGDFNVGAATNQTNINTNIYVDGTSVFNGDATFNTPVEIQDLTVPGTTDLQGNTTIGDAATDILTVNSASTLQSTLTVNDDVTISADSTTTGNITVGTNASNAHTVNGSINISNDVTIADELTVEGNVTIGNGAGDTQTITGLTTHAGDYTLDKLYLDDNDITTTADDLVLDAATQIVRVANDLVVTGDMTISGTTTTVDTTNLAITDNTITINDGETGAGVSLGSAGIEVDRGSASNVSILWDENNDYWTFGNETLQVQSLQVAATTTFTGSNTYVGNQFFDASVTLGDNASDSLTVNATSNFKNDVDFDTNINIDGNLVVGGNTAIGNAAGDTLTITATPTIAAPTTINNDLTVAGNTNLNGNSVIGNATTDTLVVEATSTFNGNVTTNGDLTVGNSAVDTMAVTATTTFANPATFNGNLVTNKNTIIGDAAADSLTVNATADFGADVSMNGNITLGDTAADTITVNGTMSFAQGVEWSEVNNKPDPTITLSGAVTGSGTMTDVGNVTIATTATADPVLTLAGDVTGTATFTNLGNATLTATVVETEVDHDGLSNFVANEHINHANVSITAGTGLTGGGTIAATRTLNVGAGNGITVNADDIEVKLKPSGGLLVDGTGLSIDAAGISSGVDHDALNNFVANEHIDHSAVSITAGTGLTGGGDLTSSRTLNIGAGTGITVNADDIAVNPAAVNHDALSNFVANEHINHANVSITAGNGLTGGGTIAATRTLTVGAGTGITVNANDIAVDEANVDHDALSNFVANEHIDHSAVSVTAGNGLTGGGTIAATRTINVVGGNGLTVNADNIEMSGSYTGDFTATGNITAYSDERIKENFEVIPEPISKIRELTGYTYDRTDVETDRQVGLVAQDVQAVLPEAVIEHEDGKLSLAYGNMVALLIEGMKEQQEQIDDLKAEINKIKQENK